MELLKIILQVVVALGIVNVWILRFGKATQYRGGTARNLKEEFAVYGLPSWFMLLVGVCKLSFAALLFAGIWYPEWTQTGALGMAVLMAGAVSMHIKVKDPLMKMLPASAMLVMSLLIAFL